MEALGRQVGSVLIGVVVRRLYNMKCTTTGRGNWGWRICTHTRTERNELDIMISKRSTKDTEKMSSASG